MERETRLVHAGRDPERQEGIVNPPLYRASTEKAVAAMVDGLQLFKIGASFGGFESLIVPVRPERTARPWREPGFLLRLHVGLEAVEDLMADLEAGLARLGAALRDQGEAVR